VENYQPDSFKSISANCSLLNLRGFDKERILESHKKYVRRDIRKAQRSGVTIRSGTSREDAQIFYQLYCLSRKRLGLPPMPYLFFLMHKMLEEAEMQTLGAMKATRRKITAMQHP